MQRTVSATNCTLSSAELVINRSLFGITCNRLLLSLPFPNLHIISFTKVFAKAPFLFARICVILPPFPPPPSPQPPSQSSRRSRPCSFQRPTKMLSPHQQATLPSQTTAVSANTPYQATVAKPNPPPSPNHLTSP